MEEEWTNWMEDKRVFVSFKFETLNGSNEEEEKWEDCF